MLPAMAVYAIGDIQGCYDTLEALLRQIGFDRRADRLWLAGDLVNRGPRSLDVLRWASGLGDRADIVLGNHDLHLLAVAAGVIEQRPRYTLGEILGAPDCDELIDWLRRQPLLHVDGELAMVHAGLLPSWTIADAERLAGRIGAALRGDDWVGFLERYYDDEDDELVAAAAVLTRMRVCTADGEMIDYAGPPAGCPEGYRPWYAHESRAATDHHIYFGHWAAHGFWEGSTVTALDSGCVWGNRLTAVRLDDRAVFQQRAID